MRPTFRMLPRKPTHECALSNRGESNEAAGRTKNQFLFFTLLLKPLLEQKYSLIQQLRREYLHARDTGPRNIKAHCSTSGTISAYPTDSGAWEFPYLLRRRLPR